MNKIYIVLPNELIQMVMFPPHRINQHEGQQFQCDVSYGRFLSP